MKGAKLLILLVASSLCLSVVIAAQETCAADLDAKGGDDTSNDWEGEFFPSMPKIKYEAGEQKESDAKRCKTGVTEMNESLVKPKVEQAGNDSSVEDGEQQKKGKGKNAKPEEPPKDYVHIRARRGLATDSYSLADRVRRERMSQRMKFLQDLVPGCNKVIGKALMLDEIINYMQSLQRQVEFLSMKLATVNPLDFSNLPTLLHKDMYQACGPLASSVFSLESSNSTFPFSDQGDVFQSFVPNSMESQCTLNQLDLALSQATNAQYVFQDGTANTNLQQLIHGIGSGNMREIKQVSDGEEKVALH